MSSGGEWLTDMQKIGLGLTGFGVFFTFLGVLLLFDGGFLAMGNILFLVGITLVIGLMRTYELFFQKRKWKGSVCFFLGIMLVFMRHPVIGIFVELFGAANLFRGGDLWRDFFPTIVRFARRLPVLSTILDLPVIRPLVDNYVGSKLPV